MQNVCPIEKQHKESRLKTNQCKRMLVGWINRGREGKLGRGGGGSGAMRGPESSSDLEQLGVGFPVPGQIRRSNCKAIESVKRRGVALSQARNRS